MDATILEPAKKYNTYAHFLVHNINRRKVPVILCQWSMQWSHYRPFCHLGSCGKEAGDEIILRERFCLHQSLRFWLILIVRGRYLLFYSHPLISSNVFGTSEIASEIWVGKYVKITYYLNISDKRVYLRLAVLINIFVSLLSSEKDFATLDES